MRVIPEPSLRERTTLRLGGRALAEVWIETDRDWERLPEVLRRWGGTPLMLGQGSNVLALDAELPCVLIRLTTRPPEFPGKTAGQREALVHAGQRLAGFLADLRREALSGLEGLIGIPGSVGGAVAMNAGSYGCTLGTFLRGVQVWTQERGLIWLEADQVQTGYRFFDPGCGQDFWVVARARLGLQEGNPSRIRAAMREVYLRKKAAQPVLSRTCGCVFKNPGPDMPSGKLLEQCGLRGYRIGDMGFSERHANFLVNHGRGRSAEALELIDVAREACRERFQTEMELEIEIIGA